ncbi:MAG: SDR family NAD(P)-dependent oxidoreductase [Blastocatellia bacterium]|nr:SDR family NAD(P)-dependent oxidoreductase [Blastocatellia bacterium]
MKEKVVLITGASSGIGRASAVLFAQEGSSVVAVGRNENELNKLR